MRIFATQTHYQIFNYLQHTPPIYTPIYVYRRFLFIMSKLLNINTLHFLTSKAKIINTS